MTTAESGFDIDGLLLLDKPAGLTSNQALQQVKRLMHARKAGHTGSLDPIATGLLPLCFGETTKIAEFFLGANKTYRAKFELCITTDSGDTDGRVLARNSVDVDETQINTEVAKFRGKIKQVPPMFSALKKDGKPLYKLARAGITVEREAREVTVHHLRAESWDPPFLELTMKCSRGFYVRSLAVDLGEALGCGARVAELRRTKVGALDLDNAISLSQLEAIVATTERHQFLLRTDQALGHLPAISLAENQAYYLRRGHAIKYDKPPPGDIVRVHSPGGFIGLAEMHDGKIFPKTLFGGISHQAVRTGEPKRKFDSARELNYIPKDQYVQKTGVKKVKTYVKKRPRKYKKPD